MDRLVDLGSSNGIFLNKRRVHQPVRLHDQAAAQAQQTTPEQKAVEAREVGQRAAKGGAVGTGAAALGLILGALAAAFGGKTGGAIPGSRRVWG